MKLNLSAPKSLDWQAVEAISTIHRMDPGIRMTFIALSCATLFLPAESSAAEDGGYDPPRSAEQRERGCPTNVELGLDLRPKMQSEPANGAAMKLEASDPRAALRLARLALRGPLEPEERAAVRYLEALSLMRLGRVDEAFSAFEALFKGAAPPGLDVQAAWHHARLGLRAGSDSAPDSVWEALSLIPVESRHGARAALHRSRKLLSEGDLDAACLLARRAASWREGFRSEAAPLLAKARCIDARARLSQGDLPSTEVRAIHLEAAAKYREVALRWPNLEAGKAARLRLTRLEAAGFRPPPSEGAPLVALAERIAKRRGPRTTTSALIKVRRLLPREARHEVNLLLASTAKERRHFRTARRLLTSVYRHSKDREERAAAALGLEGMRARWAAGAADRYVALADAWPGTDAAGEALARAGEVSWRLGRVARSKSAFQRCLASPTRPSARSRCAFGLAWLRWRGGDPEAALALLEPIPKEDERTRYWYARILDEAGEESAARSHWAALAGERTLSYYSLLAWNRLGTDHQLAAESLDGHGETATHPDVLAAYSLLRMGLASEAGDLMAGLERARLSAGDRRLAGRVLHELDETPRAIRMAPVDWDGGLPSPAVGAGALDAALAYPRGFAYAVESEHRHPAVPEALLYALIRAESAFDPEARSHARALGLTQVIFPTARSTAGDLGIRPFRFAMLTEPEMSVRVGSAHLGSLIERYDGRIPLAVAAYNAGETAVDRWLARWSDVPGDVFLEEIPFRETNRYTRRVLSFWAIYRDLYESVDDSPLDLGLHEPLGEVPPEVAAR